MYKVDEVLNLWHGMPAFALLPQKDKKVIVSWLAHHDPKRNDFNDHVMYIFNHAICIGCFDRKS